MERTSSIIQDPLWQVIGVGVAVVGIILFLTLRHRRSLSCRLLSVIPLSNTISSVHGYLKVVFKKKTLKHPYLIILEFVNTGNTPLKPDDFVTPVSIRFSQKTKIITAELMEENPPDLHTKLRISGNSVEILPMLLNPDDKFLLKLLLDEYGKEISISARIAGIKEIHRYPMSPLRALVQTFIFGVSVSLIATLIFSIWLKIASFVSMLAFSAIFIIYGLFHSMIHIARDAQELVDPERLMKR